MYEYKSLKNISYKEISKCFNLAFSDYNLDIQLTEDQIKLRFELSGVRKELSYGAFVENEMVAFIFNSCSMYNGQKVAFDVGTGTVPDHRSNKVFSNLFEFNKSELKKLEVKKYYLEVLQQNTRAVDAYKKKGFTINREFSILKSPNSLSSGNFECVKCIDFDNFSKLDISKCQYLQPSYEHSIPILNIKPELYSVLYIEQSNITSAYCIFCKSSGHIVGIGFYDKNDLNVLVKNLTSKYINFIVKNIDVKYTEVLSMFHSLGFDEIVKQFEMVRDI